MRIVTTRERIKTVQPFLFSVLVVIFFFAFIELVLRISGFEPTFHYKSYAIPSWMEELDPAVLEKYQKFVAGQGFVNEDVYAYQPDLRYGYKLKPDIAITVRNYSSVLVVDKLPAWDIFSDTAGFRVPSSADAKTSTKTLHVLGDSSSFGWGVDYEKSYPSLLMDKLNVSSHFNLRNLSLPGFSSFQGKLLWREMGDVKKDDWVILSFGWNDASPSQQTDQHQFESRNSLAGRLSWRLRQVLFFRWMRGLMGGLPEPVLHRDVGNRVPIKQYRENLEVLIAGIQSKGAKPLLVSVCNPEEYLDTARKTAGEKKIPFANFPSALKPFLSTVHDRYPDQLVAYFEAYGEGMEADPMLVFLFPDRCHPNEIGHGLMAEVLFEIFERETG